jgi:hypothetical protein
MVRTIKTGLTLAAMAAAFAVQAPVRAQENTKRGGRHRQILHSAGLKQQDDNRQDGGIHFK